MKYGSLFSGIEAATVAWHPLGWKPQFFAEIEPFPSAVLADHYPDVPNLGDVTKVDWGAAQPIDLLVFGSPCQSFSVAGKRLGLDDPRGNLALYALQVAARLRPRWLVFENVPGLLSSDAGRDFGAFLGLLGECGYGWAYRVLDAQYVRVDGYTRAVPQRRRRVFVVGYLGDWRRAAAVLFERESLSGHPAPRREAGQGPAAGTLGGTSPGGGWRFGADEAAAGHLIAPDIVPQAMSAKWSKGSSGPAGDEVANLVAHSLRADGFDASEDGTGRGTPLVPVRGPADARTGQRNGTPSTGAADRSGSTPVAFTCKDHGADAGEIAPTLRSMGHDGSHANGGGQVAVAFANTAGATNLGISGNGEAPPITTRNGDPGNVLLPNMAVRRLTPRECERLQGFPDDYTAITYRKKSAADGPRYKGLGNSMAVNCMRWIGMRIVMVEEIAAADSEAA